MCIRHVSGRDGTDRCVRDTQNKKGGEGGCVYVRGRGATDVYKQMTPKGKKGGGCMCVRNLLMCRVRLIE